MRKAFDANVPRLKPRLKSAVETAPEPIRQVPVAEAAAQVELPVAEPVSAGAAPARPVAAPAPAPRARGVAEAPAPSTSVAQDERTHDVQSRRERLAKIKRRVAEAAKPVVRAAPVPTDPARAAESVLGLVQDMERELMVAREREEALRADLDATRGDLARAATEARVSTEKLGGAEAELAEKRLVLSELLAEMGALEEERDEAVRRAQALSALDEERARLLEEITHRADDEAKARAEREAEVEKLSEELRHGATETARLRAAIGELARERDQLGSDLDRARRERDELASAKGALEQVHAALAQARARIG